MAPELIVKISNDKKLWNYLSYHSDWYKYLNRSKNNYKSFYNSYRINSHNEKIKKASGVVDTLNSVNSILQIFN